MNQLYLLSVLLNQREEILKSLKKYTILKIMVEN